MQKTYSETDIINYIAKNMYSDNEYIAMGIGDDAAILNLKNLSKKSHNLVVSKDIISDEVDFIFEKTKPELIGRKALAVNLSDLAAMSAEPLACVLGLMLPRKLKWLTLTQILEGFNELAMEFDCPLIGGDVHRWEGPLALCVTIFGSQSSNQMYLRSKAKVGDVVCVTGSLGGSVLGKHLLFTPRVRESLELTKKFKINALMDISDGLAKDLWSLIGDRYAMELDRGAIPISQHAFDLAKTTRLNPFEHAFADGEDYELLFTLRPTEYKKILTHYNYSTFSKITAIGRIKKGRGLFFKDGEKITIAGFEH